MEGAQAVSKNATETRRAVAAIDVWRSVPCVSIFFLFLRDGKGYE
jgi:hypothetical protein